VKTFFPVSTLLAVINHQSNPGTNSILSDFVCTILDDFPNIMDQNAQPVAAGGTSTATNAGTLVLPPAFIEDPAEYLTSVSNQQPSRHGLAQIAGAIAKWFVAAAPKSFIDAALKNDEGTAAEERHPVVYVARHYLQAAAVQLQYNNQTTGSIEQEMLKTKYQYEVLEAVGAAAALCTNRAAISSTGILPTLAQLMLNGQVADQVMFLPPVAAAASFRPTLSSNDTSFTSSLSFYPPLQQAGVEFLQCAILAEQYRFAARHVDGTWPRPTNTVNIRTVLRYYYLRGIVHLGCGDYVMAHRCWWTCLAVPAEACCAIMVAAWKKLSLVQPLLDRSRGVSNMYNNRTPSTVSTCFPRSMAVAMTRLFNTGKDKQDEGVLLYTQLGPATETGKIEVVKTLIETHETLLKSDGNYGLAQECMRRVQQNLVWEASQLFSVVSVEQLSLRWTIDQEQISRILLESQVPCRIEDDGMVVFGLEDLNGSETNTSIGVPNGLPPPHNHPPSDSLWTDLSEWMQLLERLQYLDTIISTSSKFQSLTKKEEKGGGDSGESSIMSMVPRAVQDF
jgi:hypothetical protein